MSISASCFLGPHKKKLNHLPWWPLISSTLHSYYVCCFHLASSLASLWCGLYSHGDYALASCWSRLIWVQRSSLCFCPGGCPGLQKRILASSIYLPNHFLVVSQPASPVCRGSGHGAPACSLPTAFWPGAQAHSAGSTRKGECQCVHWTVL